MVRDNKSFQDAINAFEILKEQFIILNKGNKNMETKKFALFMNNGDIITITAASFNWTSDDTLDFYDDNDDVIAVFKQNALFGVSECCYEVHEKQLMLPKFDDSTETEAEIE